MYLRESETQNGRSGTRGSNQTNLRAYNERLVLTLIRQSGPLAKAEVARITGLSAQTVSVIVRSLESEGLLEKGEPVRGRIGQPSVPMGLARNGAYFLGLKVGRRSLDLVLTDFLGKVVGRVRQTHSYPEPDGVIRFANAAVAKLIKRLSPAHRKRVAGLGIAIPFRLWDWAKALNVDPERMSEWRTRDIAAEIAENWEFSVYLCNDASAACGAELVFGARGKPPDFLYFFVGFFVGGGLVLDNVLVMGRSGNAGALGSLPVRIDEGPMVQLVDVASLAILEQTLISSGFDAVSIWDDPDTWSIPPDVLETWLDSAVEGLAQSIYSCCCVLDFGAVYIDGWMPPNVRALIVERTAARIRRDSWVGIELAEVHEGTIGSSARELGAASLPLSDNFLVDRNAFLKG